MPDPDAPDDSYADELLYPAGYLAGLPLDALIAERDRQHGVLDAAVAQPAERLEPTTMAAAATRARLCTQEMIRRRLATLTFTELEP